MITGNSKAIVVSFFVICYARPEYRSYFKGISYQLFW